MGKPQRVSLFDEATSGIEAGIRGENEGLPIRFNRLVDYLPNIQKGTYYLIGGETGSGKTSFTDDLFLFTPFDYIYDLTKSGKIVDKKIKFKVIYFSFEIKRINKIVKAMARRLYLKYNLLTDINYVLSKGKNRISTEAYELVKTTRDYFDIMEDHIEIYDIPMHPTAMDIILNKVAREHGTTTKIDEYRSTYTPHDPNTYIIVVVDHAALVRKQEGLDTKGVIDRLSASLIAHRNKHNFIGVVVSQFNRTISSTDRFKLELVRPQLSDFKDTGNTQQDAEAVLAIFSPNRYDFATYHGYNTALLGDRFRSLSVLKNRDGTPDIDLGLGYLGEVGYFMEMKNPKDMTKESYAKIMESINEKKNNKLLIPNEQT